MIKLEDYQVIACPHCKHITTYKCLYICFWCSSCGKKVEEEEALYVLDIAAIEADIKKLQSFLKERDSDGN